MIGKKRLGIEFATTVITAGAFAATHVTRSYGGWDLNVLETFDGEERRVRSLFIFYPVNCVLCLSTSVKVMPFANLMSLLGPSVDSVAVLRGIQKVAMLVQGNWVVKR